MFEQAKKKSLIEDEKWREYLCYFKQLQIPAKTELLKEGEISQKFFIIEKGCIRVWYNNNGKDLTFQFFLEKDSVSSIESLKKNIPSPITIETIEPTSVWWIYKDNFWKIIEKIKENPKMRDVFIDAIFERTFDYMKYFFSFIKDTPKERYLHLLKERPEIIKRIPQHYIASYLGISSVHLSRIKNKIAKGE